VLSVDALRLLGRADELARVDRHVGPCLRGNGPRVLAVVGVPGIGKSRLLAEVVRQSPLSPVRRLTGFEPERQVPLAAAGSFLRDLAAEPIESAERLANLLDSSGGARGGLGAVRLFNAAIAVILESTSLLVIDDLQWLDDMSRALVHQVVRAAIADGAPLAVLYATRPTPESRTWAHSVRSLFGDGDDGYDQIELQALDRDSGIALAVSRNPRLTTEAADRIWADANGSPFWIALQATDADRGNNSRAVLTSLLRILGEDAARCLAAIVVFARPVGDEALPAILSWPPERSASAVAELVRRGVVTVRGGIVATTHDLIRETALEDIATEERTRLHRDISDFLRHTGHDDVPTLMEAIEHAMAAGVDATDLALQVASSPRRRLLGVDGFHRLAAAADAGAPMIDERIQLTMQLAALAEELGSHQEALGRLDWLSTMLPTAAGRAAAATRAAQQAFDLGDATRTRNLLERARHEAGRNEWATVAVDALDFNRLVWLDHDAVTTAHCRRRGVDGPRRLVAAAGGLDRLDDDQRAAYVQALGAERSGRLMDDDMDGLLAVSEELARATRGLGERHLEALAVAPMALRFFNRWPEVVDLLGAVVSEAEQQVYPGVAAYAAYELALATYTTGDVAAARRLHEKAERMGARVDGLRQETTDTWLCGLRALIDASAVDWKAAVAALIGQARREDNPHCRLLLHQRAATLTARFDPDHGRELVVDELAQGAADAREARSCSRASVRLARRGCRSTRGSRRTRTRSPESGSSGIARLRSSPPAIARRMPSSSSSGWPPPRRRRACGSSGCGRCSTSPPPSPTTIPSEPQLSLPPVRPWRGCWGRRPNVAWRNGGFAPSAAAPRRRPEPGPRPRRSAG
jgi:hypothetical protein